MSSGTRRVRANRSPWSSSARMLRACRDLNDIKIVMVVDRADLEDQLSDTAKLIGGKINLVDSRAAVRESSPLPPPT